MVNQASMNIQPLVSVIIPTHNRSKDLARALTSLKKQTYKNLEVIVIDDASADDTESVVRSFEADLKLIYIKNTTNQLAARSRNIGLKEASGEYIALLDDDDEFLEEKIEIQLKTALSLNKKAFIFCNGHTMSEKWPKSYAYDPQKPSGFVTWAHNFFPVRLELPPPSSWFFHREALTRVGYFDELMERWEDIDYFLRLALAYPPYMINEFLVRWYASENSLAGMSVKDIEAREYFLRKHFNLIHQDGVYLYKFYWRLGKDMIELGRISEAKNYFQKALFLKPYKLEALGQIIYLLCRGILCRN